MIQAYRHSRVYLFLMTLVVTGALAMTVTATGGPLDGTILTAVSKNGLDLELRSESKILADEALSGQLFLGPDEPTTQNSSLEPGKQPLHGPNVQVNDPRARQHSNLPGLLSGRQKQPPPTPGKAARSRRRRHRLR